MQHRKVIICDIDIKLEDLPYDKRCQIPRLSRVMKILSNEGDLHKDGSKATTYGGAIHDGSEIYVVKFDNQAINEHNTVLMSQRKIDHFIVEVPGKQLIWINP